MVQDAVQFLIRWLHVCGAVRELLGSFPLLNTAICHRKLRGLGQSPKRRGEISATARFMIMVQNCPGESKIFMAGFVSATWKE